jgi:hypothetical protein
MIAQSALFGAADAISGIERLAPRRPRSRSHRPLVSARLLSVDLAGDASLDRGRDCSDDRDDGAD